MSHYMWKSTWKWRHAQIVSALFVKGRSSLCMIFYKKASVKNFTKIDGLQPVTVTKKIPAQEFSYEFCEIIQKLF